MFAIGWCRIWVVKCQHYMLKMHLLSKSSQNFAAALKEAKWHIGLLLLPFIMDLTIQIWLVSQVVWWCS